jgi:hypothetical protein
MRWLFSTWTSLLYITDLAVGIEIISTSVIVLYAIHGTFICIYMYWAISNTTHWWCAFHLDFVFQKCYFKNQGLAYSKTLGRCVLQNLLQSSMCHFYWSEMRFSQAVFIQLPPTSVVWNINEDWWKNEVCINE